MSDSQHLIAMLRQIRDTISIRIDTGQIDYQRDKKLLLRCLQIAEEMNLIVFAGEVYLSLAIVEHFNGNIDLAVAQYQFASEIFRKEKFYWGLSSALNNLAEVSRLGGQLDLAQKYYEEAIQVLEKNQEHRDLELLLSNLGLVYLAQEKYDLAEAQFGRSLTLTNVTPWKAIGSIAQCNMGLGMLFAARQEFLMAHHYLDEALKLVSDRDFIDIWVEALLFKAQLCNLDPACSKSPSDYYQQAEQKARQHNLHMLLPLVLFQRAIYCSQNEQVNDAVTLGKEALRLFASLGLVYRAEGVRVFLAGLGV